MAFVPYGYPYGMPENPLVDHPHQRLHQHQTYTQHLRHKTVRPEDHPNTPDLDFSDAIKEYLIEVELPGIKKPDEINVTWTGQRALLLTGTVERPVRGEGAEDNDTGGVHLLVGERRTGPFRRYMHFPTDVENVSVTLEAGLLKIVAPKKGISKVEEAKVDVKHE